MVMFLRVLCTITSAHELGVQLLFGSCDDSLLIIGNENSSATSRVLNPSIAPTTMINNNNLSPKETE